MPASPQPSQDAQDSSGKTTMDALAALVVAGPCGRGASWHQGNSHIPLEPMTLIWTRTMTMNILGNKGMNGTCTHLEA